MTRQSFDVDQMLREAQIIVCCGAGGVGKTTTSAALALRAAEAGRRVVVMTIDPARRLAQALGIDELDNTPRPVLGVDRVSGGALDAMMLDMKRTFDEIVLAHTDAERAAQILGNPFYQSVSSSFAGTQEYMAMEKLGQLAATGDYDLVVVDTPPTRSALDFLDAPQRLSSFLDGRLLKVLLAPAKVGGRAMGRLRGAGAGLFTGSLTKLLGGQLLGDVSMFVSALETMFGGFRERAAATYALMTGPETAFVVVAAPEPDALREAQFFAERLDAEGMHLAGMVLNRVHNPGSPIGAARARTAARTVRAENRYASAALEVYADRVEQATYESMLRHEFDAACPGVPVAAVSARASAVVDLSALRSLGAELASGKARRTGSASSGQA